MDVQKLTRRFPQLRSFHGADHVGLCCGFPRVHTTPPCPASRLLIQLARLSEGNAWNMNAFDPIKTKDGQEVERGLGNHCSVEFSVLYRVSVNIRLLILSSTISVAPHTFCGRRKMDGRCVQQGFQQQALRSAYHARLWLRLWSVLCRS